MKITEVSVKELKPYAKNTKKHDKTQIANVAESIKQYGFVQPIVVDKDNSIVIGHCRYEAAKKLKLETVPCVCVDELTDEQVKALRIVDNKSNESPWDMEFLADELAEIDLSDFDLDFGINAVDENDIPNVEEKELKPCKKVHYLITLDINENDKVIDLIKQIESVGGVEVDSTLN